VDDSSARHVSAMDVGADTGRRVAVIETEAKK